MAVTKYGGTNSPGTSVTTKDSKGNAFGPPGGQFLVDTGASQSMIDAASTAGANVTLDGVKVFLTAAGPAAFIKAKGASMTFKATPKAGGAEVDVTCTVPVSLGGGNILGNDQLIECNCKLEWDPVTGTGVIRQRA